MRFRAIAVGAVLFVVGLALHAGAQTKATSPSGSKLTGFGLEQGTPVPLRLAETLTSVDAKPGQPVHLTVTKEIAVNGKIVITSGAAVAATVSKARGRRRLSRGGFVEILVDHVQLADGETAALEAGRKGMKGPGGFAEPLVPILLFTGVSMAGGVAMGLIEKGDEIALPEGTEFTAYVSDDMQLDSSKFPNSSAATGTVGSGASEKKSSLTVSTDHEDGDVYIDGNYRDEAPMTTELSRGVHLVVVRKTGFREWHERVAIAGDPLKLSITLQPKH